MTTKDAIDEKEMKMVKEFFTKFELPIGWIDEDDSEIRINEGDSNEFPSVNDGDETYFDISGYSGADVSIRGDGDVIDFKGKSKVTTDFFEAKMVEGDREGNIARVSEAMSEAKEAESATFDSTR